MTALALLLLAAGFFFILSGAIGVVRLPDFYTRLHAMGKCDTLGVALMTLGLALLEGFTMNAMKMVLILVFVFLANPTATHALGRAAHRAGLPPWREGGASSGGRSDTAL
jgi:multicomponent Na+:H+ antiporter subunit G